MSTPQQRLEMGALIVGFEGRRDAGNRLAVYALPPGDGGGTYEIAGINDKYHPEEAALLRRHILDGEHAKAETLAAAYIATYTDTVAAWTSLPAAEFFLRDSAFNRGRRGAALILQIALGVVKDGVVGAATTAALAKAETRPAGLLTNLRDAREFYERHHVGRNEKSKFWKGLVSRWTKALTAARTFQ